MPEKGFFGALFDLSFSSFVTTKIIKVLYVLAIVIVGIAALAYVIFAFAADSGSGAAHADHPRSARVPAVRDLHAGHPGADHRDLPDHGDQHRVGASAARLGRRPAAAPAVLAPAVHAAAVAFRASDGSTPTVPSRHRLRRCPRSRRRAPVVATTLSPARRTARIAAMTAILRYTAFTDDPAGGNPAGVVLDASELSDERMQEIAAELGYSETAFVVRARGSAATTCATSALRPRCRSAGTRRSRPASRSPSATVRASAASTPRPARCPSTRAVPTAP